MQRHQAETIYPPQNASTRNRPMHMLDVRPIHGEERKDEEKRNERKRKERKASSRRDLWMSIFTGQCQGLVILSPDFHRASSAHAAVELWRHRDRSHAPGLLLIRTLTDAS